MHARLLFVDLGTGRARVEALGTDLVSGYVGGRGINSRLLWDTCPKGIDPLGPENVLVFGAGLLTGTDAPCSGRTTVTCKSPATGLFLKASSGGHFGAELKFAGFAHVAITGKADHPVYLFIDDGRVEVRDATRLWGLDVRETNRAIQEELGDEDVEVACIGPAGENRVAFAAVMLSVYHAAARGGPGAVMGSKNLKAVAVRGSRPVAVAQPERFAQLTAGARESLAADPGFEGLHRDGTSGSLASVNEQFALPVRNFQASSLQDPTALTGGHLCSSGLLKRRVACFSCTIGCHRYVRVDHGPYSGTYTGGPEYETLAALGAGCGVLDTAAVIKANELCNIYGLDTISTGSVIQWAFECFQRGVLTRGDAGGLDLSWGNADSLVELVRKIAFREGIGSVLAGGVRSAAEAVGHDSWKWAVESKGLEQSRVDTRNAKAYALAFAVNPRGADHLHTETFAEFGTSSEGRALIGRITGSEECANPYLTEKRAEIVRWHEDCYAVTDSLGVCSFATTALYGVTPSLMADLYSAATGLAADEAGFMALGRKIVTLERCFNAREGATRQHDCLAHRLMNEPSQRAKGTGMNSREELDMMLDRYYALHEWDQETGIPHRSTLDRLGLSDVAQALIRDGKVPG